MHFMSQKYTKNPNIRGIRKIRRPHRVTDYLFLFFFQIRKSQTLYLGNNKSPDLSIDFDVKPKCYARAVKCHFLSQTRQEHNQFKDCGKNEQEFSSFRN